MDDDHLAVSKRLVAWVTNPRAESITQITPATLKIYDLAARTPITTMVIDQSTAPTLTLDMDSLAANETVVTWGPHYGYDVVTGSFFTITLTPKPWRDWGGEIVEVSPIAEQDRVLYWNFQMIDATRHYFKASLIDATPSAAPCIEGQNLVQNGDLENVATHNVWQQSGNPSDLIVNDLPPNSPQAGQWAIRLGRYSNAQPTIQQTLNIPSGVKHISLAFDVRASSWDIWGGDQLQVDLIDPVTNQSILATPVQWTNRQLASGGWIPLQVDIQDWPGIDTPLQLVFRAQTDWAFPTDFTVDNIRFTTSCQ